MTTGARIARARHLLGFTQAELSTPLRVSREHLAALETDVKRPSADLLERLAQLVTRRLLSRIVQTAVGARRSRTTTAVQRRSLDQFRQAVRHEAGEVVRALAYALVAGELVAMERRAWLRLLAAKPRLLRGVPPSARVDGVLVYQASEVGLALEAAAHGQSYSELTANRSSTDGAALQGIWSRLGMERLDVELSQRAEWIEVYFGSALTTAEWRELRARLVSIQA